MKQLRRAVFAAVALDVTVTFVEIDLFDIFQSHDHPRRENVSAVLSEDDIVCQMDAGVEGIPPTIEEE